jgi:endonuclease YncB( thermonuclease family)
MRITLLLVLLITHSLVNADTLTGRVVRVTDGDTIVILDSANTQHKIRLTGNRQAVYVRGGANACG